MARLLKAQEELLKSTGDTNLYEFAIYVFERMLEVYESDLTTTEQIELKEMCKRWGKDES
jgi:hypothetical protein